VALVLDTGPLYSALDRAQPDHVACRGLLESAQERLVIPSPVLPELDHLIRTRLHAGFLLGVIDDITDGVYDVAELLPQDYIRVRQICDRYSDADIGFVDAAVLAIVERLNEPKVATLDHRNFRMFRPRHVDALTLLPE
jgi:uncharacterized protein